MLKTLVTIALLLFAFGICAAPPTKTPDSAQFINQHPRSDANGDGILTKQEKAAFCISRTEEALGGGYRFSKKMVPMRDGVKLATGIFVPDGDGPFPVVMVRTAYGIWTATLHTAAQYKNQNLVFICQDLRGDGDSEGKGTLDPASFDNEINDGYDTVEWVAKQSFCNGKVGIVGMSGHGFCGYMSYLAKPPHLTAVSTQISGGSAYQYWTYHNGVRREMYNWLGNRSMHVPQWPKPTITLFDKTVYDATVAKAAQNNDTVFIAETGWYDIFAESALDYFQAFAKTGKVFVHVGASGHGNVTGKKFPPKQKPAEWRGPRIVDILHDSKNKASTKSQMLYYLMGDCDDPKAPGNEYRITDIWPVPHVPVSYYLQSNGSLTTTPPTNPAGSQQFKYDPRNPVPSAGGDVFIHKGVGPLDQRVLKDRKDILRFVSEPLTAPLEITGKVLAELFVTTDVEDTTFTAKLVDIYPSGYEAIVRDSIIMTRFHQGFDKPAKVEKGHIYKLTLDMWSTALVVNKGHRLGVHISSSNSPKYEVHPNTYEPVTSFENAPIATNVVMLSSAHPSRIILPVVKK